MVATCTEEKRTSYMKRTAAPFILFSLLAILLAFSVSPSQAAQCYLATPEIGYVCDARPAQPTFSLPEPRADSILSSFTYSWIDDYAPFYAEPSLSAAQIGDAGTGFLYSTIQGVASDEQGNRWFKVNGGWTLAGYIHIVEGTKFTGVEVNDQPLRPFGWMLDTWVPRSAPAAPLPPTEDRHFFERYDFVQIYDAALGPDGWRWYDIGGDRWVKENYVAIIDYSPRPQGIQKSEFWVGVDLTQQVFAAYEGDRMVYAGLVSTGLDRWPTREGLFTVWDRHLSAPMSGGEAGDDFYNIQHVPHPMYFDEGISLHGAFWHNGFGRQKSHGCVNMPPRDAEWVYFWSQQAPGDLRVWVYANDPDYLLHKVQPADGVIAGSLVD